METPLGRRGAPLSFGAVVDRALEAYGARAPLYLAIALGGIVLQGALAVVSHEDDAVSLAANLAFDAFLCAVVTIGVAADRRGEHTGTRAILSAALLRLAAVFFVSVVAWLLESITGGAVFDPADTSPAGLASLLFLALPLVALWGPLACATVAAALSTDTSPTGMLLRPLFEPFLLGWSNGNLGRMVLLGIASLPLPMLESVLQHQLGLHHVPYAKFLSQIPVDALATGPYQALYTVFFLDLRARTKQPARPR